MWYIIVSFNELWHPPKDLGKESILYEEGYIICTYYGVLLILGADILPISLAETLFCCAIVIIGSLVMNYIIAYMTLLVD